MNNNQNNPADHLSSWLLKELSEVKSLLEELKSAPQITSEWIPRSSVMDFFDYGDTQMAALEKSGSLTVARVGNRKFIHRSSILELLQNSVM